MAMEVQREKHPWPEFDPQTSAMMGRRWLGFTPGPLKTRRVATPHGVPWFDGGSFYPPRITLYDAARTPDRATALRS